MKVLIESRSRTGSKPPICGARNGQLDERVMNSPVQRLGEPAPGDPDGDPVADDVQNGLKPVEAEGKDAEGDQGRDATAGYHPVVDLEHEE